MTRSFGHCAAIVVLVTAFGGCDKTGSVGGRCGDGIVDIGEECDDGDDFNSDFVPDACRTLCRLPLCGDGVVDTAEECDPPNVGLCDSACLISGSCGDGIVQTGEECDDGANNSDLFPDACRTDCTLPVCGDAVADTGEECDDGLNNSNSTPDACRSDCTNPVCGDNVVDTGEMCDPPDGTTCNPFCITIGGCGDGAVDPGEECDDGLQNSDSVPDACRTDCTLPVCGDDVVDSGEDCDPPDGGWCDVGCLLIPGCGNGVIDPGEECDSGALNSDVAPNACRTSCVLPFCGDGVIDAGESCDPPDGVVCDNTCQIPPPAICGNGITELGEECDEGIWNSDTIPDRCRTNCTLPRCGDNVIDTGETCDPPGVGGCPANCGVLNLPDGTECDQDWQCASGSCLTELNVQWPRGMCAQSGCDVTPCADPTTLCQEMIGFGWYCLKTCTVQTDCRSGYGCFDVTAPSLCLPDCDDPAQCANASCNEFTGLCEADNGRARDGEACLADNQCESGLCLDQAGFGLPGGYCTSVCAQVLDNCPTGGFCSSAPLGLTLLGTCLETCLADGDCRQAEGYTCQTDPGGGAQMVCWN